MRKTDNQKKTDNPPVNRLFIKLVLAIFVIETAVMLFFHFFLEALHLSPLVEGLADSLVLVIFLLPILYFLFYRPLSSQIARYKQSLEAIQGLKTGYGLVIHTAMDGFWLIDIKGRILEVNDSYCRLTGYSRQELLAMSVFDLRAQEKPEDTKRHIQRIIESGGDRFESHHRCKDGRIVDLEVSVNYLAVDGGRLFAFLRDITERKQAQMMLEKLAVAVRRTADMVVITDKDGKIEYVNPAFEAQTGYKAEEAVGQTPRLLKSGQQDQSFYERLWKTILSGEVFRGILINKKKDGRLYYSEETVTPIKDEHGVIVNFVFNDKDITLRKLAEEELLRLNKELWDLDRRKNEFINMSSHELRTPIAIIREGISQMVEGLHGELKPEQKYFLDKSFKNVNRLIKIVDNIFEISRLDSEKAFLEEESLDMVELVRSAIADCDREIKKSGLEIRENFRQNKVELDADRKKISRVLTELIRNALKFTGKGYIEIQVEDKEDIVEVSVKDSGKGIAEESLPMVFDKFQQFDRDFGPGERGTGLGLAIVKGFIELHKGKIWVESKLGEGTKFTFSLPKGK